LGPVEPHTEVADHVRLYDDGNGWAGRAREIGALGAVRADQLLEERTLPYDEDAVEQVLRRWPGVRCRYEAGPTGFGLYRDLIGRGIDCCVVAPGLVPHRPATTSRPIRVTRLSSRVCSRASSGSRFHVPSHELKAARDLVRALRTRVLIGR
jgi:transposase